MGHEVYQYWISNLAQIGPIKIEKLLQIFGSVEAVYEATKEQLELASVLKQKEIETLISSRDIEQILAKLNKLKMDGIHFISKDDPSYPKRLKQIYGAPYALYAKGNLLQNENKILAIVGARESSPYGKEMAKYFAGALASEGVVIISGLARGIDSYAHEGALSVGGITYGVMGCGIDICYPKENINLYMDMQQKGGIISEYAPGIQPFSSNFPMRNRIISGLCDGILVIEAKEKSGSLITVDMGLEQGKDIYAIPGRVTDRLSEGCNNLIKMGAKMVTSPKDILEDFYPNYKVVSKAIGEKIYFSDEEKLIYGCLSLEPTHIELIAQITKLSMNCLMEHLFMLELKGSIRQSMRNYYVIT